MARSTELRFRAARVPLTTETLVLVADHVLRCRADNISTTGMLLSAPLPAPPGLSLRLRFCVSSRTGPLEVAAIVARATSLDGRPAWGVKFEDTEPAVLAALQTYVQEQIALAKSAAPPVPATPSDTGRYSRTGDGSMPEIAATVVEEAAPLPPRRKLPQPATGPQPHPRFGGARRSQRLPQPATGPQPRPTRAAPAEAAASFADVPEAVTPIDDPAKLKQLYRAALANIEREEKSRK